MVQYSFFWKARISRSRSTTRRRATVCTRPADRRGAPYPTEAARSCSPPDDRVRGGLLRLHQRHVHLPGLFESLVDGFLGDFVEHHAEDLGPVLAIAQFFLQVIANGFSLTIGVSREVDFLHFARSCLKFGDQLLLPSIIS